MIISTKELSWAHSFFTIFEIFSRLKFQKQLKDPFQVVWKKCFVSGAMAALSKPRSSEQSPISRALQKPRHRFESKFLSSEASFIIWNMRKVFCLRYLRFFQSSWEVNIYFLWYFWIFYADWGKEIHSHISNLGFPMIFVDQGILKCCENKGSPTLNKLDSQILRI